MSRIVTVLEKTSQLRQIRDSEEYQVKLVQLRKQFRSAMDMLENIEIFLLELAQLESERYRKACVS